MVFNLTEFIPGFSAKDGFPEFLSYPAPIADFNFPVLSDLIAGNTTRHRLQHVVLLATQPAVLIDTIQALSNELLGSIKTPLSLWEAGLAHAAPTWLEFHL